ncbi:hypothetical protein JQ557_15645 [Bradyrhizobium sp. U87765 SZCCT0131]|uniref:hypothetical protein n=1 Tax=unclassified Bradyrhizobium TaxID=2631580 RepID=UPI001BA6BD25|nr:MULTISPECIES: hypothetical protein [unclassified Bradyrhizobium]MBR1219437.1 hypothetical protein [Bradyrhizobium sp. U87765 SZCCT0131]MBR1262088.1 hypothetical protein [Bradyrhizobium sp. U87765 SZCCT0134]MBR1306059.1 hypothetical protein [Bradyrhizobium sp. U87765 SZCCT0110]MBR1317870.1 hypothetical protein [Bradyrhizobium sp. U87765 SZCCT0109]MBR1351572.1 hypothetical protein [Bradyrhizobium sp. U87765 SZCCT0048]
MSRSAETLCVPPERVALVWPHVEGFLGAACARSGDWTLEALRGALDRVEMLLWVLWDGEAFRAAAVTEVMIVPRGKICRIVVCGGRRATSWPHALAPIEAYARELGCTAMRVDGRRGWQRVLDNYAMQWITLEKRL